MPFFRSSLLWLTATYVSIFPPTLQSRRENNNNQKVDEILFFWGCLLTWYVTYQPCKVMYNKIPVVWTDVTRNKIKAIVFWLNKLLNVIILIFIYNIRINNYPTVLLPSGSIKLLTTLSISLYQLISIGLPHKQFIYHLFLHPHIGGGDIKV